MTFTAIIAGRTVTLSEEEARVLYIRLGTHYGDDARMGSAAARAWVDELFARKAPELLSDVYRRAEASKRNGFQKGHAPHEKRRPKDSE